jgi:hypothetical protein
MPSITLCNPKQLNLQRYSQTSTGISGKNFIFDRESGKVIVIQYPSFDLMVLDSSLSFRANWNNLPLSKLTALLKFLSILHTLPESALEEAVEQLERVSDFYSDRFPQASLPTIPASIVKGNLKSTQVRPPIVLGP